MNVADRSQDAEPVARCCQEIQAIELELLGGNPDIQGLFRALSDWSTELRILQNKQRRQALTQRREGSETADA